MSELKPCPFCGAKAVLFQRHPGWWVVKCSDPEYWVIAETLEHNSAEVVVQTWNRRTPNPDLLALLREARDAIDHMSESASGSLNPNDWADALIAAEEIATRLDAKIAELEGTDG